MTILLPASSIEATPKDTAPSLGASGVQWHVMEERVIVLSAHTRCPDKESCDMRDHETYEQYVRRHLADHNIPDRDPQTGESWDLLDAERNLSIWCLYYFHKWIQGNMSLLPDPCWEDADFLANGTFTEEDLEQNVPWEKRNFKLKPYAERVVDLAKYKRMRKMTKVRETQKSSWCKAFITWRHLRAYFVEKNIYFRVMVVSAFSALARDSYLEVFGVMWAQHEKLTDLFGAMAQTSRGEDRQMCLLDWKKTKLKDGLQLRWNVNSKQNTGQSVTSLFVAGVTTATAGRRWDLIVVDDPCVPENSGTDQQRAKVKRKSAELRKELSAIGELVWLNTPHSLGDASEQIDKKFADEFHILYRPARWGSKGDYSYYWQRDGVCSVRTNNIPCDRPRHEHRSCNQYGEITAHPFLGRVVWDVDRIEREERQLDFYSQVLLMVRDERHALFHPHYFEVVPVSNAPEEVRFGLGHPLTPDEREMLVGMKRQIIAYNQIDTAGKEEQTKHGCRNAIIGVRFDHVGTIWITHIHYGFWSASQEVEAMWASCVRNQPDQFEYEVSGAHEKYARAEHARFQGTKSMELRRPVMMPITYVSPSEGSPQGQNKRIEKCEPYARTGRIKILADAGAQEDIDGFIEEFCNFPWGELRDGPDAFSRVLKRMEAFEFQPPPELREDAATPVEFDGDSGVMTIQAAYLFDVIADMEGERVKDWGDEGQPYHGEALWKDNDSVPPPIGSRSAA